jgi:hypothetical protein
MRRKRLMSSSHARCRLCHAGPATHHTTRPCALQAEALATAAEKEGCGSIAQALACERAGSGPMRLAAWHAWHAWHARLPCPNTALHAARRLALN